MLRLLLLTTIAVLVAACTGGGGDTIATPAGSGNGEPLPVPATYEECVASFSAEDCDTDEFWDQVPEDEPADGVGLMPLPVPGIDPAQGATADEGAVAVAAEPIAAATADLSERTGVPGEQIRLVELQSEQWPDASLGLPKSGVGYAQVVTPGFIVTLDAGGGSRYVYHTDEASAVGLSHVEMP